MVAIHDLRAGDMVLTDLGYSGFISYIHEGSIQPTVVLYTDNKKSVELTRDHLIKTNKGYVHASDVEVGDVLSKYKVVATEAGQTYVVSPLTRSGSIVINGFTLSCYANVLSHNIANLALAPIRMRMIKGITTYVKMLVTFYNALPLSVKSFIATQHTIQL